MSTGIFKVTNLRNIAITSPYIHDGRFKTLEEVIEHYNEHIVEGPFTSPKVRQNNHPTVKGLSLTKNEVQDIVAFLKSLTDEAFVKDIRFSDPFKNKQ